MTLYFFIRQLETDTRRLMGHEREDDAIHELLYCERGTGTLEHMGRRTPVLPGDLLFDPIGRLTGRNDTVSLVQVLFSEELFSPAVPTEREALYVLGLIKIHARKQNRISLSSIGGERVAKLLDNMLWEFRERRRGYSWALRLKLIELLITVMRDRQFPITIRGLKPIPNTRMQDVIMYLEREFVNPVTVDDVLALVPLSRSHFHALFKEETGETFVSYLSSLRCSRAAELLCATERSVLEVALDSGFNNISHFYHLFKRHFGVTPREYRESRCHEAERVSGLTPHN